MAKVKSGLFIFLVGFLINVNGAYAQVSFEKEYSGEITIRPFPGEEEPKFYQLEKNDHLAYFYNSDHSLFRSLIIPAQSGHELYDFSHYTRFVFDTDSSHEFIAIYRNLVSGNFLLKVIDINGEVLLRENDFIDPLIVKVGDDLKMILYSANGGLSRVYALQGNETGDWEREKLMPELPWPNPSNAFINLPYSLPEGMPSGKLTVYDLSGTIMLEREVGPHFNSLRLPTGNLSKGTYIYRVTGSGVSGEAKKFVVR